MSKTLEGKQVLLYKQTPPHLELVGWSDLDCSRLFPKFHPLMQQ